MPDNMNQSSESSRPYSQLVLTDFVVAKEGESPRYFKTSSTPGDPSEGVMTGLGQVADAFAMSLKDLLAATDLIIHGTTVATNTLVERRGAKVGLITTEGLGQGGGRPE